MLAFLYLVSVISLYVVFVLVMFLMRFFKHKAMANILFVVITFICYASLVLVTYLKAGSEDWNFRNVLPFANISPFMFTVTPIFFLLPLRIRKYPLTLISLLGLGMILSPTVSCIRLFMIGYQFHPEFLLDYIAHLSISLFGVYLVQSKQVELHIKDALIGGAIIIGVGVLMLVLNAIFDTSFFGLNLHGKHRIYNQVLVDNSYLSALIYFAGLIAALIAGYFFQKLLLFVFKNRRMVE